jgi:hypothetical protein
MRPVSQENECLFLQLCKTLRKHVKSMSYVADNNGRIKENFNNMEENAKK